MQDGQVAFDSANWSRALLPQPLVGNRADKAETIVMQMESLLNPRFIYLILGVIFLALAVVSICTGKAYSGYGGWACRANQPAQFWWGIVVMGLSALVCTAIYLHSAFPEVICHPERWLRPR